MDVKVPSLGEGAEAGTVVKILVSEGDRIEKDQTILELENEKAVAPIPSTAAGKVEEIYVKKGDELSVGDPILSLSEEAAGEEPKGSEKKEPEAEDEEGEEEQRPRAREAKEEAPRKKKPRSKPKDRPEGGEEERAPAAPSVRQLARQVGIDLARVPGSERGGRITLEDLRRYIQWLQERAFADDKAFAREVPPLPDFSKWGETSREPLSGIRKTIARRMRRSWDTVPHVTQFDEAWIDRLLELKARYDSAYEEQGTKLTLGALVVKAVVPVLKEFPVFNASLDAEAQEIVFKNYYNIGLAVATDRGLVVPVLRDANRRSLLEISREMRSLAEKALEGKLSREQMEGASFTISNQGGIGGGSFTPLINPPESAILGVGRAVRKPAVRDEEIVAATALPLALSYDHRLTDGADAARFITALVERIEGMKEEEIEP